MVKQIVGGSLRDEGVGPVENFVSDQSAAWFAEIFRNDQLTGGHVIKLGPGNGAAAREALAAWPGGLQIGGGITPENAREWLDAGASHVIVTSAILSINWSKPSVRIDSSSIFPADALPAAGRWR
jgi:phosphoribosylformimino-5-aminoimidazole carboxamide ribotide isomerase